MTWVILLLALLLRLVFLNQSLWLDEAIEALALMGRLGPILSYALKDFQPPLYHFLGIAWTQLAGYSEIALRMPSLLAGMGTVYFLLKFGELLQGKKLGIVAGLLAATNPLLIYYSQEGRTYALTAFLVTASMYYFFQLLNHKSKSNLIPLSYFLFTTLYLWTSYLSWFVFIAQFLYLLFRRRYDLLRWQFLAGLTLLPWLPSLFSSLAIGRSTLTRSPAWGNVVGSFSAKALALTWVKLIIGRVSFADKFLYGGIVAGVAAVHLFFLRLSLLRRQPLLWLWLGFPILMGSLLSIFLPVYSYTRVLFIVPAYLLLLSSGLASFRRQWGMIIVVGLQLTFLTYFWFSPQYHREDWRQLVHDLRSDPSAVVAMPSRAQNAPLLYYGWDQPIIEPCCEKIEGNKIYYLRYAEDLFDVPRVGPANLRSAGYTISSQVSYPGLQVDIYEHRN